MRTPFPSLFNLSPSKMRFAHHPTSHLLNISLKGVTPTPPSSKARPLPHIPCTFTLRHFPPQLPQTHTYTHSSFANPSKWIATPQEGLLQGAKWVPDVPLWAPQEGGREGRGCGVERGVSPRCVQTSGTATRGVGEGGVQAAGGTLGGEGEEDFND